MAKRSPYAALVGEWVETRRAELRMRQEDLAERVGAHVKTVTNVENGRTSVMPMARPAWERALGWPAGSLTAAYRRGERPQGGPRPPAADLDEQARHILVDARIPGELAGNAEVREILDAADLTAADKAAVLRVWLDRHRANARYEQVYDQARARIRTAE